MKVLGFIAIFLSILGFKPHHPSKIYLKKVKLGEDVVIISREDYGPGKIYVHLHANETTALKAARYVAKSQGGQVITLIHDKERDVNFRYHRRNYSFDPNRIFTNAGIVKTLKRHHCYNPKVKPFINAFAKQILATIPSGKVVAVHNNRDYSLKDYFPHHVLAKDAKNINHIKKNYFRNFFLVTKIKDFKHYKALGFNVIQQCPSIRDDGSLSVIFSKRQYVNVEAGFGQLSQQERMLRSA
jgi:hypothetical protein